MIALLASLGWLKTALTALIGMVRRYPCQMALIASLLACGWLWQGKHHAIGQRDAALAEILIQANQFKAAQDQAEAEALLAKQATEAKYEGIAHAADIRHAAALDRARSASSDYVRTHRVRIAGASCQAVAPTDADPAQRGDGQGDAAGMVVLSRNDFDQFVENSLRLQAVHEWGEGLIKEKLAMPEPTFGQEPR